MPDEKPDSTATEKSDALAAKKPRSKRRLIHRRRIWALVILLVICFLINGPFARWLALYGLNKGLTTQGMQGNAEISGTLSQGFTLRNLSYVGREGIQSMEIAELTAQYKFTELFSGKIQKLDLSKAKIVIDLDAFAPSQEKEKPELQLKKTLAQIHSWISQPTISISEFDLSLLKSGEKQAQFLLSTLTHQAGANDFHITGFTVIDRENRTTPSQNTHLIWKSESAALDRFEVLPDIAIKDIDIQWSKGLQGSGLLELIGSTLQLKANEKHLTAQLSDGHIDSTELSKRFDLNLPADFSLAEVNILIGNWKQPIPEWDINTQLTLAAANYKDYQLSDTRLQFTQKELAYQLTIEGAMNNTPLNIRANGKWHAAKAQTWWGHTSTHYEVNIPKLGKLSELISNTPPNLHLGTTAIQAEGEITLKDNKLTAANTQAKITGIIADQTPLPALDLLASYLSNGQIKANLTAKKDKVTVGQLNASYNLNHQDYQGTLDLNETSPQWINALATIFKANFSLDGALELSWNGQGNTKNFTNPDILQKGQLKIQKLQLTLPERPTLAITTEVNYHWPESISIPDLSIREGDWLGNAKLLWDSKFVDISYIELQENKNKIATMRGKLPFKRDIDSSHKFLEQQEPWDVSVKTQTIALSKLSEWFQLDALKNLIGTVDLNFELSGSPSQPQLKGEASARDVKGVDDNSLAPLEAAFYFQTQDQKLSINGELLEADQQRFKLQGSIPFTPSDWLKDPHFPDQFISEAPLSAEVAINTLPLERFKNFIPQLETIQGAISGNATLTGTVKNPTYVVNLNADIPLIRVVKSAIGDIRNIQLSTQFTESQKVNTKLTAQINGGKFEAGGSVDMKDIQNPIFDIYLRTQYALVHRDDNVSVRANSDLKLKGKIDDATLSGNIGIAESLFYKDIELIPIGVPSSEVAKVKMPALAKKKSHDRLPIPEPFADWKLDVTLRTDDPVLIRGNVAAGNLTGSVKISGTLAQPAPLGTISVNKVKAKLPFSILEIAKGEIKFTPEKGLDPTLNIRGKSTVGAYDVNVFAYGPASSPKTTFTSYPPLPETDVMALIATGTTTAGLENRSVATFKAFQVFLMKLQQRNDKPSGNKLFKSLLSGIDDLNLNVGETDPFTGRKFTSATVDIHPHWNLTAQVDDTQQTRGLIVYVIRFR